MSVFQVIIVTIMCLETIKFCILHERQLGKVTRVLSRDLLALSLAYKSTLVFLAKGRVEKYLTLALLSYFILWNSMQIIMNQRN